MKIVELRERIMNVSGMPAGTVMRMHARKSWGGRAMVGGGYAGAFVLYFDGMSAPYCPSFEDAIADDWELVE